MKRFRKAVLGAGTLLALGAPALGQEPAGGAAPAPINIAQDEPALIARLAAATSADARVGDFAVMSNLIQLWTAGEFQTEAQGVLVEALILNEFALKPGLEHFAVVFYDTIPPSDLDLIFEPGSRFYDRLADAGAAFAATETRAAAACGLGLNAAAAFLHANKPERAGGVLDRAALPCAAAADPALAAREVMLAELAAPRLDDQELFQAFVFGPDAPVRPQTELTGWFGQTRTSPSLAALAARAFAERGLSAPARFALETAFDADLPVSVAPMAGVACPMQNAELRRFCYALHARYVRALAPSLAAAEAARAAEPLASVEDEALRDAIAAAFTDETLRAVLPAPNGDRVAVAANGRLAVFRAEAGDWLEVQR